MNTYKIGDEILVDTPTGKCMFECTKVFQLRDEFKSKFGDHIRPVQIVPMPDFTCPPPPFVAPLPHIPPPLQPVVPPPPPVMHPAIVPPPFVPKQSRPKCEPKSESASKSGKMHAIVYRCGYCRPTKKFVTIHGIWLHRRKNHGKEFEYQCRVCPAVYKRYEHLKEHRETHRRLGTKVECDFCKTMLRTVFEKENHIKEWHSDRRYHCQLCTGYCTKTEKNLKQHIKTVHTGQNQRNERQ